MGNNEWVTRKTLLQRAKNKDDEKAWEEFVSYYKSFISMLIVKMRFKGSDYDDLTQEILLNLWQNLAVYDEEQASFRTWMSRVVKNTILKYYRTIGRQSKRDEIAADQQELTHFLNSTTSSDLEQIIENEWKSYVSDLALAKLKELFSGNAIKVFTMSLQGMSGEDISAELGIKTDSVYVLKNRVKSRFLEEVRSLVRELEY